LIRANFNVVDIKGSTPLHYAAFYALPEIFTKLLAWGANADIQDNKGRRALERCDRVNKWVAFHACHRAVSERQKEKETIFAEVYSAYGTEDENMRNAMSESLAQQKKSEPLSQQKNSRHHEAEDENMRRAISESVSQRRIDENMRSAISASISQQEIDEKSAKQCLNLHLNRKKQNLYLNRKIQSVVQIVSQAMNRMDLNRFTIKNLGPKNGAKGRSAIA